MKKIPSLGSLCSRVPLLGRLSRRFSGDERGVTLVYVAISLPVILGFAGLGIDIAVWNLDKRESQAMADAGALAAGQSVMRLGDFSNIRATALAGAQENAFGAAAVAVTANGFTNADGESIIINNPPLAGPRNAANFGDPDGDGIAGDTSAIEVIVRRPVPTLFSSLVIKNFPNKFVRSRTVITAINDPGDDCFMSLDPDGGIKISGTATVNLDCGALTNGDLELNGGGCLTSTGTSVVGTADDNPCSTDATPAITRPDPLRFLPDVLERTCERNPPLIITNGNTVTLQPKGNDGILVLCGDVSVQPGGTLILGPGVYVMHGVKLQVAGTLQTMVGEGAMVYFTEDASNANSMTVLAGAVVNFEAMTSDGAMDGPTKCEFNPPLATPGRCDGNADIEDGPVVGDTLDSVYAGIAFFGSRDIDPGVTFNFTGDANMSIDGVLYFPTADVDWSGGSGAEVNAVLAANIKVSGNSTFSTLNGTILEDLLAFVFIKIIE